MAKKPNKRELREQEKASKVNYFKQIEEQKRQAEIARQEKERQEKIERETREFREKLYKKVPDDARPNPKKHSIAKASGLKSTFALEDGKVLMTSFGDGNDAVIEKLIEGKNVTNYANNLEVEPLDKDFSVKRPKASKAVIAADPQRKQKIGKDLIDRKDVLEQKYFGETFDDNIHIQLIYNIMDIEKIMSIYINNILYGLNNVLNRDESDSTDNIGTLNAKTYEDFKNNKTEEYETFASNIEKPQLSYFGAAFYDAGFNTKARKSTTGKKSEEDIY